MPPGGKGHCSLVPRGRAEPVEIWSQDRAGKTGGRVSRGVCQVTEMGKRSLQLPDRGEDDGRPGKE